MGGAAGGRPATGAMIRSVFFADVFNSLADDGQLAIDPAAHEPLVGTGRQALLRGDVDGLRDVVFDMLGNRISLPAGGREAAALATIMR
jgi:hypothetical protein